MVSIIFWGIIAFLIMVFKSEGDAGIALKLILILGIFSILAAYGVHTDSTLFIIVGGVPLLLFAILVICLIIDLLDDH